MCWGFYVFSTGFAITFPFFDLISLCLSDLPLDLHFFCIFMRFIEFQPGLQLYIDNIWILEYAKFYLYDFYN